MTGNISDEFQWKPDAIWLDSSHNQNIILVQIMECSILDSVGPKFGILSMSRSNR